MWFDLRGFALGWVIVALSLAVYYGIGAWPTLYADSAMRGVYTCVVDEDLACVRPFIREMLAEQTGAEVMDSLSEKLDPMLCHYFGHVVGQETYMQTKDVEAAIRSCNRACDSACVHGAIGGAFADALEIEDLDNFDMDLKHMKPDQIREIGKSLCTTIGTCHGVGHSIFQIYQEFEPSFALCREIAPSGMLGMCYNGATMEYADTLSSRSATELSGVTYPAEESLASFCVFPTLTESRACFRYFPRIVRVTLAQNGVPVRRSLQRVANICESYQSAGMRIACYGGLGSYGSYEVRSDMPAAIRSCEMLAGEQAVASCIAGRLAVATEDRGTLLAAYCAASSTEYQPICYHSLFYYLERIGIPTAEQEALCDERNTTCKAALEKKHENPLEVIATYSR